jgi:hypothetical protein
MTAAGFLLVTVVMGVLLAGTGIAIARMRRGESSVPVRWRSDAASGRPDGTGIGPVVAAFGLVAVLVAVSLAIADPLTVALLAGPMLVVAYLMWGIYVLGRSRGLPKAHSVGLSTWIIGIVLIGLIAVQLLVG